jgi:hypothetical protein
MFRTITFVWLSWMQPEKITLAEMRASAILQADGGSALCEILGCRCAVPELTRSADIQLNKRLALRRRLEMLSQPQIVY